MPRYQLEPYPYMRPTELDGDPLDIPIAIVGAGPIGLTAAIDLALHGIKSVVLDDNNTVSVGSRAICWAKRTLEIFDRLGVAQRMLQKGVTWKVGRLFHGENEIYSFDLLPEDGHQFPAFINLQQYYVEQYLVERCADFPDLIDLRWKNRVVDVHQKNDGATLSIETPDGRYEVNASYLLACDGVKSQVRQSLGLELVGHEFEERFLIADVEMQAEFPNERWFWFQPPFHPGQTALLHKQPDNIYRIDLQLGWDVDPEIEKREQNVLPRLEKAVGGRPFKLDWMSLYTFRCARMQRFVHDHVIFLGDSAHVVSPFGARGGNGGIHDVDNLVWKLALVLKGGATPDLLESYNEERTFGADENIKHSERATHFMSPPDPAAKLFRDQTLSLATHHPFARRLINSGRLSDACSLANMSLQTPCENGQTHVAPGTACPDARLSDCGFLLQKLGGEFTLLAIDAEPPETGLPVLSLRPSDDLRDRYGRGVYLIRPDQHVAAFWPDPTAEAIKSAHNRAIGRCSAELAG